MLMVYNTLTQRKEAFQPQTPKKINLYVCGVTVYDFCHLGHARTYVAFDVIVRYLRSQGYEVTYVRNITDIDDKIIKRAHERGTDYQEVVARFTTAMQEDFSALNLLKPDHEPRATQYIVQMIEMIKQLIANGSAYVGSNGDIYYDVRRFSSYGCLAHHDIEQLESGARVEISEAKKDPLDFVLWKLAKPGEPAWDAPWGQGRPGWHIECSVMSMNLLGKTFDIHGGGRDLIFPHHENEIAQSEAFSQQPFVKYWLHTGFLQIDKEKMSKSLGNFFTIRDVLKEQDAEVLRYFMVNSHYRSPLSYSLDILEQSQQALTRLYTALRYLPPAEADRQSPYYERFTAAMNDDFNTPVALSVLFDLAHEIQRLRENDLTTAARLGALLRECGAIFGLLQKDPEAFFQTGSKLDVAQIESLITARQQARANKDWAKADEIRQKLTAMSVTLEDTAHGTTWKLTR